MRRLNHEHGKAIYVAFCALPLAFVCACASTRNTEASTIDTIVSNQRAASTVEAAVGYLENTVSSSHERIGAITETSATIADAIGRLEYLFEQYESEVDRLLREIDTLRATLKEAREADFSGGGAFGASGVSEGGDFNP